MDSEAAGDSIVSTIERMYHSEAVAFPEKTAHEVLARVWRARMFANGNSRSIGRETFPIISMIDTQWAACLPPPQNARALGLSFLLKERPDIAREYPRFEAELTQLVGWLMKSEFEAEVVTLYAKQNPGSDWQFATSAKLDGG
jgi:hypothetical protein